MAAAAGNLWTVFVAQLRADRKRAAVLGILVVVFMFVCGRLFMSQPPEPLNADARALMPAPSGPTIVSANLTTSPPAPASSGSSAGAQTAEARPFEILDAIQIGPLSREL